MVEEHMCGESIKNKNVSAKWLAKTYVNKIRRELRKTLESFIGDVFDDYHIEITKSMAWRAIQAAGYLLFGNEKQQFVRLWSYANEIMKTMPTSTVCTKLSEKKFKRIYICPRPLKDGFRAGYRRFLCVDGCFLKGAFKGQILAVVGVDADNDIYPIALAVVEVENTDYWTWFIQLLRKSLQMDKEPESWILMTDQQKGLENAIKNELPHAEHRLCVKHLHANWSKKFPGNAFRELMWECARAANVPYHEYAMEKVKAVSNDAYEALEKIDRKKWTRCAFRSRSNCPQLVNNWAEAFNIFIIDVRDKQSMTCLSDNMTRIEEERERKMKCKGLVCPRVNELLVLRGKRANEFITRSSGSPRYEVSSARHCFVVDIEKRTCSCELWQLGGIPCVHAVCVFRSLNKDPKKYVHQAYLKTTFLEVYSHTLEPLNGPTMWSKSPYPDILPPDIRVLPERPKRCRRLDPTEAREKKEKQAVAKAKKARVEGIFKAPRHGAVIHCKICGSAGHNAKACPRRPMVGASSQPTTSTQPIASTQPAAASSQPVTTTPSPVSTQPRRRSSKKK